MSQTASTAAGPLRRTASWLRRRAENVAALLIACMFVAFILQIVFRYLLNYPVGWAAELSVICWLWLVLWGAAFIVRDRDEIRFDFIYGAARPSMRRRMAALSAVALIALYAWSLPAAWDYVTFMKVQKTAYLGIRYDLLYSIFVIFAVATILRQAWIIRSSLLGASAPADEDQT